MKVPQLQTLGLFPTPREGSSCQVECEGRSPLNQQREDRSAAGAHGGEGVVALPIPSLGQKGRQPRTGKCIQSLSNKREGKTRMKSVTATARFPTARFHMPRLRVRLCTSMPRHTCSAQLRGACSCRPSHRNPVSIDNKNDEVLGSMSSVCDPIDLCRVRQRQRIEQRSKNLQLTTDQ